MDHKTPGFSHGRLMRAASIAQDVAISSSLKDHYRLVVMGSSRVGKTAIIKRFLYQSFTAEYKPTVEELLTTEYDVRGAILKLDILDTSGSYEFPAMRHLAISSGDAFVLVYSIDDADSFEEVRRLRDSVLEIRSSGVPIVVAGNKSDLEEKRSVRKELAETLVCIDWEHGFVESSAKDNINISTIFKELFLQGHLDCPKPSFPPSRGRRSSLPVNAIPVYFKGKHSPKRSSCALS
ncbi:dexamethasone-induced Ras-related protein 1-like [Limulus polyphemus]|uniref:Dexamethasone-induced Ras-related protein 1-like n=1 Tax=Limulus polyphemus TaxID=6850 RepID=A0ABM1TS63_LIMPO|nr:dexamethasone-induced Ras-related protein 1-like [Limulus polyphemus]XP_022258719.1 dexamethasone-induced Ras-related protein 1-like [Limulus polyphemus]